MINLPIIATERQRPTRFDTRRITVSAYLVCVAFAASILENMFPPLIPLAPFAKLGLSNVAPLFALVLLGAGDAFMIMLVKCLLGAAVTGGVSGLIYSVPSGVLSLAVELLLFYTLFDKISVAGISLFGAVVFNVVQLAVASFVTGVNLAALIPIVLFAGVLAGAFTGLLVYNAVKILPYSIFSEYKR